MAANEPKPSSVTITAEAPPAPAAPEKEVHILPIQTVAAPVERAPDAGLDEVKAQLAALHSKVDAIGRQPAPKEEPKEEPVVAVAPPPPPPEPPDPNASTEPTGPRKRGFLERFLHSGCPD